MHGPNRMFATHVLRRSFKVVIAWALFVRIFLPSERKAKCKAETGTPSRYAQPLQFCTGELIFIRWLTKNAPLIASANSFARPHPNNGKIEFVFARASCASGLPRY